MGRRMARCAAALAAAVLALHAGCAPITTVQGERIRMRSERFAEYVEHVFREQNRVATALAFAFEDAADPDRLDALEAAEDALLEACTELNALAAARRDGERFGPVRRLRAAREAPQCERAAAEAATLL